MFVFLNMYSDLAPSRPLNKTHRYTPRDQGVRFDFFLAKSMNFTPRRNLKTNISIVSRDARGISFSKYFTSMPPWRQKKTIFLYCQWRPSAIFFMILTGHLEAL